MDSWEVYTVMIPAYYGKRQADEAVLQMDKKINNATLIGDHISYKQFRLPNRFIRDVKMIGDIKLLLIKRVFY